MFHKDLNSVISLPNMDQKYIYCLGLLLLGSTYLAAVEGKSGNPHHMQYTEYLDGNRAITRVMDLLETPDYQLLQRSMADTNAYLLFTRKNPSVPQQLTKSALAIRSSNFQTSSQTVVVVHGWLGSRSSELNPTIRDAYLKKLDVNVIIVDWSPEAQSNYVTAALSAPEVGWKLGRFLIFLRDTTGISFSNMHLVGFSLGAHVVGNAGKIMGGSVARITGLDPAGPLWGVLNLNRLMSTNAVYVEAIHTDAELLGTRLRSGDVDFYPNGGFRQPGCRVDSCSHSRSWQLFAVTVTYDQLVGRKCSLGVCNGDTLHMGNTDLYKAGSGQYRVNTIGKYPYTQIY